jgi:hypothetical protein
VFRAELAATVQCTCQAQAFAGALGPGDMQVLCMSLNAHLHTIEADGHI